MISVICVYNNKKILDDWLIKSLQNQTVKHELIAIDNTQGQLKSAAQALNYGGKKATGKYFMFVHQDVDLCSFSWLEDAEKMLDLISNLGIAGVVGVSEKVKNNRQKIRNVIKHGIPPTYSIGTSIKAPEPVQTLDECLVIIPKQVFEKLRFDETICDDWHLYGVDYCLSVKRINSVPFVIPLFVYHQSKGFLSRGYYKPLQKLARKHKDCYKKIYTTCGLWNTKRPLLPQITVKRIEFALSEYREKLGLTPLWSRLQYFLSKFSKE